MSDDSDETIKANIFEANELIEGLQSGKIYIGAPSASRTEAKISDLKRQIGMWQSTLDKRNAKPGPIAPED